jgi:ribulose bisphosphate carboxylase small subunit
MQIETNGTADAKRHIQDKGYRIIRYDMPLFRTGYWEPYHLPFRHFGIEESTQLFASLGYCRAYNAEMDRQLMRRYGAEYRKLRSKILPKPDAGLFQYQRG